MLETIKEFAEKGLFIGVYPVWEQSKHEWVAYVMVKDSRKWLKGDPGCTMSAFNTIDNAFNAAATFCRNYHGEKKTK